MAYGRRESRASARTSCAPPRPDRAGARGPEIAAARARAARPPGPRRRGARGDPRARRGLGGRAGRRWWARTSSASSRASATTRRTGSPAETSRWRSRSRRRSATACTSAARSRACAGARTGDGRRRPATRSTPPPPWSRCPLRSLDDDPLRPAAAARRCATRSARRATATRPSSSSRCASARRPSAVLSVPERYWTWTARAGEEVQPVAHAFAGSPAALERLAVSKGPDAWFASLARLRPDLELDPAARCCRPGPTTRGPAAPTRCTPRAATTRRSPSATARSSSPASTPRDRSPG